MRQPDFGTQDPRILLERLKKEHKSLRWEPLLPSDVLLTWQERQMRTEESLTYLHHHWQLPNRYDTSVIEGKGLKARLAGRVAAFVFRVLQPYLSAEQDLIANMVRINDSLAKRCDELSGAIEARQIAEAFSQARLAALIYDGVPESHSEN